MKRVFIAIRINPGKRLSGMISALKTGLKDDRIGWTGPENLHITLAFLGDTANEDIKNVGKMLSTVCSGSRSFTLRLKGTGLFRNLADPRVIWAGVEDSEDLLFLQKEIRTGLRKSGISIEERPFSPHLTLGRIKSIRDRENLREIIEEHKDDELEKVQIDEVIFYESVLMQTGAVYTPLGIYKLGKD